MPVPDSFPAGDCACFKRFQRMGIGLPLLNVQAPGPAYALRVWVQRNLVQISAQCLFRARARVGSACKQL